MRHPSNSNQRQRNCFKLESNKAYFRDQFQFPSHSPGYGKKSVSIYIYIYIYRERERERERRERERESLAHGINLVQDADKVEENPRKK